MLPQLPFAPEPFFAAEQAWHAPAQGASQQKPSTQLPVPHSLAAVQASPAGLSGWHVASLVRQ
jgi:hypothetical protein